MVREEVPAQAVFRLHTCGRWGKKCERIEWTIVLCRRCYPRGGSSPRATEENADVQSESNVTKVLAFPLWNRWFRRWFARRDSVNVARRRRLEVRHLLRNVQKQNRHQHWVHVLALQGQAVPSPSGQGAHHFSRLLHLAVGGVGVGVGWGWGSGPLGAATRCPRRRRPFHFFFATWPFLAIRNVRVLGFTTDDDETGLPPLNPLVLRTENRQIFIANFFFQKKIWRQIFFGDFN